MTRSRPGGPLALAVLLALLGGCAARPALLGSGATVPAGRSHLSLGAQLDLGGVPSAPLLQARYGVSRRADVGLTLAGGSGSVSARAALHRWGRLVRGSLLGGAGLGAQHLGETRWAGLGDASLLLGLEAGGLYELWAGPRLLALLDSGGLRLEPAAALGMALGFRRLHVLVELNGALIGSGEGRTTAVWWPAIALRLRL